MTEIPRPICSLQVPRIHDEVRQARSTSVSTVDSVVDSVRSAAFTHGRSEPESVPVPEVGRGREGRARPQGERVGEGQDRQRPRELIQPIVHVRTITSVDGVCLVTPRIETVRPARASRRFLFLRCLPPSHSVLFVSCCCIDTPYSPRERL